MQKCRRKLKLVDFGWYFVVLTSGFYLTALTTAPHSGAFMPECRTVGGKQNRGKLASCMSLLYCKCQRGQKKHCSPKKTKTAKNVKEEIDSKRKKLKLLHTCRDCQTARQNTSESCACPERLWQVLG